MPSASNISTPQNKTGAMALTLEIVTPEEQVELSDLKSVVFHAAGGEIGILPGHLPLICKVDVGVLTANANAEATANEDERCTRFVTGSGLARIFNDRVCVLVHQAIAEDAIDRQAAEQALSVAKSAADLPEYATDPETHEQNLLEIRYARAQLELLGMGWHD